MAILKGMGTWDLKESPPPDGIKAIPSKIVLVRKQNDRGEVIKYKARLVAWGDLQHAGDYKDTFAPTARIKSIRIVNVLVHMNSWITHQFDVNSAYLHGILHEPLWIKLPDGTTHRLRKSIYGLKQAGHEWNDILHAELIKRHFVRLEEDRGVYHHEHKIDGKVLVTIIAIFVDDGIIAGNDDLKGFLEEFSTRFKLREGDVDLFLGMIIT